MSNSDVWTTQDELEYLKRLGMHSFGGMKYKRKYLLLEYLKTMWKRNNWGGIDPEIVRSQILYELGLSYGEAPKEYTAGDRG